MPIGTGHMASFCRAALCEVLCDYEAVVNLSAVEHQDRNLFVPAIQGAKAASAHGASA